MIPLTQQILDNIEWGLSLFNDYEFGRKVIAPIKALRAMEKSGIPVQHRYKEIIRNILPCDDVIAWCPSLKRRLCGDDLLTEVYLTNKGEKCIIDYIAIRLSHLRLSSDIIHLSNNDDNKYTAKLRKLYRNNVITDELLSRISCVLYLRARETIQWVDYITKNVLRQTNFAQTHICPVDEVKDIVSLKTNKTHEQLKCVFEGLASAGYIDGRRSGSLEDFLRVFDTNAVKQGKIVWARKAKNKYLNKMAICDFMGLHGVPSDRWADVAVAIFDIELSKSTVSNASTGSAERGKLQEILGL